MAHVKKLGIWMDHSKAHIMEFSTNPMVTKTIELKSNGSENEYGFGRNEKMVHNKEQHQQLEFYKKLGGLIKNYEDVVLFGPTDAKVELYNILGNDRDFDNIKIKAKQAGKMTENQQHAFVREYFSKH